MAGGKVTFRYIIVIFLNVHKKGQIDWGTGLSKLNLQDEIHVFINQYHSTSCSKLSPTSPTSPTASGQARKPAQKTVTGSQKHLLFILQYEASAR